MSQLICSFGILKLLRMLKSTSGRVLVIDDDADIRELLQYNLNKEGYEVKTLSDGRDAVNVCTTFRPNVVLLDIMMPFQDGVETCMKIRQEPSLSGMFIIFLTARSEEYSEIAAFDNGADDYLIKPIRPRALMSRIKNLLKKEVQQPEEASVRTDSFEIDSSSYTLMKDGNKYDLPKKEFELLYFLARNPEKIFSRDVLLNEVWGYDVNILSRTVDVHIRKIREKIGDSYIHTIKGVGYKFVPAKQA